MKIKNAVFVAVGCLSVVLGTVGAFVPLLPTVPFLLLATYLFAASSQTLNERLKGSKIYKENVESLASKQGLTPAAKMRIITLSSTLMLIAFFLMKDAYIGRIILIFIWIAHVIVFAFVIKTAKK